MKLVETFLLSEEFEKELMLIKFILSNDYIDEWIICENSYSFQGEYKGTVAEQFMLKDKRFAAFRNKVRIITGEKIFISIDKKEFNDKLAFESEDWQRQLAVNYFLGKYDHNDWLIIHDVDEMFDFTDEKRRQQLFSKLRRQDTKFLAAPCMRYWFDFDNKYAFFRGSALCTKQYILDNPGLSLAHLRRLISVTLDATWKTPVAFEYSSCFSVKYILRKVATFAHTNITVEDVLQSLRCNHRTLRKAAMRDYLRPDNRNFLELVKLTEDNSPSYIREHLSELKTNNIDINYEENRRKDYPRFYNSLSLMQIQLRDFISKKNQSIRRIFNRISKKVRILRFNV
jgi:hypothetical protein